MKYFIFDTETTGLGSSDEVIQFSGFLVDEKFRIKDVVNFYCNVNKAIPNEAIAIHGINNAKLWQYSGGNTFEDCITKYDYLMNAKDIVFVGYQVSFDIRMTHQSLQGNGHPTINFGQTVSVLPEDTKGRVYNLCMCNTLKTFKKHKLEKMIKQYFGEDADVKISKQLSNIIKKFKVNNPNPNNSFHDSLFDAYATLLLFIKNIDMVRE